MTNTYFPLYRRDQKSRSVLPIDVCLVGLYSHSRWIIFSWPISCSISSGNI